MFDAHLHNFLFISDTTRLGVWILDGDQYHSSLLKFTLNADSFNDSVALLVVNMNAPWSIMETLNKWSGILKDHIDRLNIPREKRREYEENCKCLDLIATINLIYLDMNQ